jgi:hypothetical protein
MMPSMKNLRLVGALAAALLLALAGCSPAPSTGTGSGAQAGSDTRGNSPAAAPPNAAATTYPTAARAYAEAVLAAWRDGDPPQLSGLLAAEAYTQLVAIPGPPSQDWTYRRCTGTGGNTDCEFRNGGGETIGLRMQNAQLGKEQAVIEVHYTPS